MPSQVWDEITYLYQNFSGEPLKFGNVQVNDNFIYNGNIWSLSIRDYQ